MCHCVLYVCGDFTLKHHAANMHMVGISKQMCNDFMVLITENVIHLLGLFACVCVCINTVSVQYLVVNGT